MGGGGYGVGKAFVAGDMEVVFGSTTSQAATRVESKAHRAKLTEPYRDPKCELQTAYSKQAISDAKNLVTRIAALGHPLALFTKH